MPKLTAYCRACGGRIKPFWPSQARQFCSPSCRSTFLIQSHRPTKPRRGDTVACQVCGKPFYRAPVEIARDRVLCSHACSGRQQTRSTLKPCAVCGKEMRLKPSQSHIQTCSIDCRSQRVKRPTGRVHNGRPVRLDNYGYVLMWEPEHPNKALHGWQYEHRMVVEQRIGRYLTSSEHVDHINEMKSDNRPENLQILTPGAHSLKTSRSNWQQLAEYRRRFGTIDMT